jgi:2,5-dihydroxypyridine 5,6-dioxygenase
MNIHDLSEGAVNLVSHYACVREGENVCVYADTSSDPLVMEAIAGAARKAGGKVVVVIADEAYDPEESGLVDPPPVAVNAFSAADVILCILSVFKMQWSTKSISRTLKEYGVRLAYIGPNTSEELAKEWARFPAEVAFAVGRQTIADLKTGGDEIIITDAGGTYLKAKVNPDNWGGAGTRGPMKKKGAYGVIPASTIGTNRIEKISGRLVLDFLEMFGPSEEICELVIEDNWITDIIGGAQADIFRERLFSIKNANLFSQISWGFNPNGRVSDYLQPPWDKNKMSVLTRLAGVIHFGFGATSFHQGGETNVSGNFHTHGVSLQPTLQAGAKMIIEKGRLTVLDAPEVRACAEKYGYPDAVLAVPT